MATYLSPHPRPPLIYSQPSSSCFGTSSLLSISLLILWLSHHLLPGVAVFFSFIHSSKYQLDGIFLGEESLGPSELRSSSLGVSSESAKVTAATKLSSTLATSETPTATLVTAVTSLVVVAVLAALITVALSVTLAIALTLSVTAIAAIVTAVVTAVVAAVVTSIVVAVTAVVSTVVVAVVVAVVVTVASSTCLGSRRRSSKNNRGCLSSKGGGDDGVAKKSVNGSLVLIGLVVGSVLVGLDGVREVLLVLENLSINSLELLSSLDVLRSVGLLVGIGLLNGEAATEGTSEGVVTASYGADVTGGSYLMLGIVEL